MKMKIKLCPNCNKEFESSGPNGRFCCRKCQNAYRKIELFGDRRYLKICKKCGKEFKTEYHNKNYCLDKCKYDNTHEIYKCCCVICGKDFDSTFKRANVCSDECRKERVKKDKLKSIHKKSLSNEQNGLIKCLECGFIGKNLLRHFKRFHNMSVEEYCEKWNIERKDLMCEDSHKNMSNVQKKLIAEGRSNCFTSENNPSYGKECRDGRNSPYSKNFRKYDGMTEDEKEIVINELIEDKIQIMNETNNNPKRIEYYTSRGYTEKEAYKLLKESQTTFSKEKCIEKYGEINGIKRWNDRQEKWLNNYKKQNYSMISQELFNEIVKRIGENYNDVYYATNDNGEYTLKTLTRTYKLDFYINDLKKAIEFDGIYWHSEKHNPRAKEIDDIKTEEIINAGINLLRIGEDAYRKNKEMVINECLNFLKS